MGTMLYGKGVFINRCFDALNLTQPDLVGDVHRRVPARRRRRHRDQHVRRQPREAARLRPRRPGCTRSTSPARRSRAARRDERGLRGRRDRPARHPHRAVGQDRRRRGRERCSANRPRRCSTAASTCSSSRRFATSTRSARRSPRCAVVCDLPIVAQMTTEEDGNSLDGTPPEQFAPALDRARRDRRRRQLQRRARADARDHRAASASATTARAVGAAQRRPAARHRGPQPLPVLAGVHGVVRAAVHPARRAAGRRLLRHDARAHPADSARGATRMAPAPRRVRRRRGVPPSPVEPEAPPVPRADKSALARALAEGRSVVTVELEPPKGVRCRRRAGRGRAAGRAAASTR